MSSRLVAVLCTLLTTLGLPALAAAQGDAQRHILDAGINLGWAVGIVQSDGGVTAANQAEIGGDLARARAHVAALRQQVSSPPYDRSRFSAVERQIGQLANRIGGMGQGEATQQLHQVRANLRDALRVFLSARTGRLEQSPTCDSAILDVGFYFGQGHTSSQRGNTAGERRARDYLRRAIDAGEASSRRLACPFGGAGYRGLPMMSTPTPPAYAQSLPRAQQITAPGTGGGGATATPPAPPTAVPAAGGGPQAGRWSGGGWGTVELRATAAGLEGTYTGTYSGGLGRIVLRRAGGTWTGTWEEPQIGRAGRFLDITVSPDGRRMSGRYDTTAAGGQRQHGVRTFAWTHAGG